MRFSVFVFLLLLPACSKDRSCETCKTGAAFVNATIIDGGPVQTDGCDWLVRIGNENYRADNLDASFKQDGLAVNICYENTGEEYVCGIGALHIPVIHLLEIKR